MTTFANIHLRPSVWQLTASGVTGRSGAPARSLVVMEHSSVTARVKGHTTAAPTAWAISSSLKTAVPDCVLVGIWSILLASGDGFSLLGYTSVKSLDLSVRCFLFFCEI